jgi:predicted transposase
MFIDKQARKPLSFGMGMKVNINKTHCNILSMFRTIKLKLPYNSSLLETGKRFREVCQAVLNYSFSEYTFNKNKLDKATYNDVRGIILTLPSALVHTAGDTASESLNQTRERDKQEIPDNKARCFSTW